MRLSDFLGQEIQGAEMTEAEDEKLQDLASGRYQRASGLRHPGSESCNTRRCQGLSMAAP